MRIEFTDVRNSELETLASITKRPKCISIVGSDATSLLRATRLFPNLKVLTVDRIESLDPLVNEQLESLLPLRSIDLWSKTKPVEADWWLGLLSKFNAQTLYGHGGEYSITFEPKKWIHDDFLRIHGVTPADLAVLGRNGGLSKVEKCSLAHFSEDYEELDVLTWLSNLEDVDVFYCDNLQRVDFKLLSPKLKRVRFTSCSRLVKLVNLTDLSQLKIVTINNCPVSKIQNVDLPGTKLTISAPVPRDAVVSLELFKDVRSLGDLTIIDCDSLATLAGIEKIHKLRALNIDNCDSLSDWDALLECRELKRLAIESRSGMTAKLPSPDPDFIKRLDKFVLRDGTRSINRDWLKAWLKIQESKKADVAPTLDD